MRIHPNTLLTLALVCAMIVGFVLVLPAAVDKLIAHQEQLIEAMNR
jgi:hypothetical protein